MKIGKIVSVTGGTGFVGAALCRKLLRSGYQPRIITRSHPQERAEGMQYAVTDYDNIESLENAFSESEYIIHVAAALFGRSKEEFEKANVENTKNIVAALSSMDKKPKKVIYISSLAAGGPTQNPEKPRTEEIKENPVSCYGETKLRGEEEIKKLSPEIKYVILRPPIVYGKRDKGFHKIAEMVKRGVMVNAGGNAFFSFIYLDDLVEVIQTALVEKNLLGNTYYVCENSIYRWKTFIELLAQEMGVKMPLMLNMPPAMLHIAGHLSELITGILGKAAVFNRDKAREASAGHWIAYSGKWERDTNWKGWTPLKRALKKHLKKIQIDLNPSRKINSRSFTNIRRNIVTGI